MDYKKLKNDAWAIKSEEERSFILTEIEQTEAKSMGRKARSISIEFIPGLLGLYDAEKDKIVVSTIAMQSAGTAIAATLHEGRHAYQNDVICGKISDDKNYISWSKNWQGYLNPNNAGINIEDYYLQPIEQDAWSYAIKALKIFAAKTKDVKITNDFVDIEMNFRAKKIKARNLYGKNYMTIIQNKIDTSLFNEARPNSYTSVSKKLSQEGINSDKIFKDYIIPGMPIVERSEKSTPYAMLKETNKVNELIEDAKKQNKELAAKYGVSEKAVDNLRAARKKSAKQTKTVASAPAKEQVTPQKPSASEAMTLQITVKSSEQNQK